MGSGLCSQYRASDPPMRCARYWRTSALCDLGKRTLGIRVRAASLQWGVVLMLDRARLATSSPAVPSVPFRPRATFADSVDYGPSIFHADTVPKLLARTSVFETDLCRYGPVWIS